MAHLRHFVAMGKIPGCLLTENALEILCLCPYKWMFQMWEWKPIEPFWSNSKKGFVIYGDARPIGFT
jgi:hypothetical protein